MEQVLTKLGMKFTAGEISSNTTLIQYRIGFTCGLQIHRITGIVSSLQTFEKYFSHDPFSHTTPPLLAICTKGKIYKNMRNPRKYILRQNDFFYIIKS